MRRLVLAATMAVALVPLVGAPAEAATPPGYGKACNAAGSGKRGTAAYRAYMKKCVKAAVAATAAAREAGDADVPAATEDRAEDACRKAFPPPRKTKAQRAGYRGCVQAAVAAQKQYGGRPLAATLVGGETSDADGAGTAALTLNQGRKQVCFDVAWTGLGVVAGVDIHAKDGSVALALDADADLTDGARGCEDGVDVRLIKDLRKHPESYTVSVRTDEYATGAISGALHR